MNKVSESKILKILGINKNELNSILRLCYKDILMDDVQFQVKCSSKNNKTIIYWNLNSNKINFNLDDEKLRVSLSPCISRYQTVLKGYNSSLNYFGRDTSKNTDSEYFDRGHILGNWAAKCKSMIEILGRCPEFFKKNDNINIVPQFKYTNSVLQEYFENKARTCMQHNNESSIYYEVAAIFLKANDQLPIGMHIVYKHLDNGSGVNIFIPNIAQVEAYNFKEYDARATYSNKCLRGINKDCIRNA